MIWILANQRLFLKPKKSDSASIASNGTTAIWQGDFVEATPPTCAVHVTVVDVGGNTIVRHTDWPQPLKHYDFAASDRGVEVTTTYVEDFHGSLIGKIKVGVKKPVKGFWMNVVDGVIWGRENGSDICPGDPVTIEAKLDDKNMVGKSRKKKWAEVKEAGFWYYRFSGMGK